MPVDYDFDITRSDISFPAAFTTRPTFAETSPAADFAPSNVRPCLRASSVTSTTFSATAVTRSVCSAANSAAFDLTVSLVPPRYSVSRSVAGRAAAMPVPIAIPMAPSADGLSG